MNRYFADLSNWTQGKVDFKEYRQTGQHVLVGLKATEGVDFVDNKHALWSEEAHSAGVWVLHYHFGHVGQHPETNAEFFWNQVGHHFASRDFVCLDIEQQGFDGRGYQTIAQWINQFDAYFRKLSGHTLIGYSDQSDASGLVRATASIAGDRWWIAAYGPNKPSIGGIKTWAWQFTDGSIGPAPHKLAGLEHASDVSILNWGTYLRLRMVKPPR